MSRIKICGLRRPEDIAAVNEARPDYCGFIVEYPKSRRSIDRTTLRELVRGLREKIIPVGVFVNAPKELVAELLEEGTIQIAQLHGQESQEYIQELKVLTEKPLIQAFSIKSKEDVERGRVWRIIFYWIREAAEREKCLTGLWWVKSDDRIFWPEVSMWKICGKRSGCFIHGRWI